MGRLQNFRSFSIFSEFSETVLPMESGEGSPIPPSPPREGLGTLEGLHIAQIGMLARKLVPVSFLCKY